MKEMKKYRIAHGRRFRWNDVDPDDHGSFESEADALRETQEWIGKLDPLQERLYAEGKRSLLIILQSMDTGGKDGTVRLVTRVHRDISAEEAAERVREINDFERMLVHSGTQVVKFSLSISKDEQRRR